MADTDKKCDCDFCKIIARIRKLKPEMTKDVYELVNDLFCYWECDSMEACYYRAKFEGTWPEDEVDSK